MRISTFSSNTYARVCQICEEIKDIAKNPNNESEIKLLAQEIVCLMDFNREMRYNLKYAMEEQEEDKKSCDKCYRMSTEHTI